MSFDLSKSLILSDAYKAIEFLTLQKWQIALLFTLKSALEKESYIFLCFLSFSRKASAQASSREIAAVISHDRVKVQKALRNLEGKNLISSKKNGIMKTTYTITEWLPKDTILNTNIKKNNCSTDDVNGSVSQFENGRFEEKMQQGLSALLASIS